MTNEATKRANAEMAFQHDSAGPSVPNVAVVQAALSHQNNDQSPSRPQPTEQSATTEETSAALVYQMRDALLFPGCPDLIQAENILSSFERGQKNGLDHSQKQVLSTYYLTLTRTYTALNRPDSVLSTSRKILEIYGFVILRGQPSPEPDTIEVTKWGAAKEIVIETWLHVWKAYVNLGETAYE